MHGSRKLQGADLDKFSFFFGFYGLILGLAVTEILGGFAGMVRAKAIRCIEPQTALLALLTFIVICATWIDAWDTLQSITLDFAGLWAPIMLATLYYLAASVIFPSNPADFETLSFYYADRKRFVIAMLLSAELLVNFTFIEVFAEVWTHQPLHFWFWMVPHAVAISGSYIALLFVKSRRANIVLLVLLVVLFSVPYWNQEALGAFIDRQLGYFPAR
jgi:hypothetical protein